MNLIKSYDENGNKCLSEGVTRDEITSLKLPDLGEPTTQDRLVDMLTQAMFYLGRPDADEYEKELANKARSLLASLEGEK